MRIWSLHPAYLDNQALAECWRDALTAFAVARGKQKGFHNHPQYLRWGTDAEERADKLNRYLHVLQTEGKSRNLRLHSPVLGKCHWQPSSLVTFGQLQYEALLLAFRIGERLHLRQVPSVDDAQGSWAIWSRLRDDFGQFPEKQDSGTLAVKAVEHRRKTRPRTMNSHPSVGCPNSILSVCDWEHVKLVPLPCNDCGTLPLLMRCLDSKGCYFRCPECAPYGLRVSVHQPVFSTPEVAASCWNRSDSCEEWRDWLNTEIRRTAR